MRRLCCSCHGASGSSRDEPLASGLMVVTFAAFVGAYAKYAWRYGGWCWGPRCLLPALGVVMPLVARAIGTGDLARRIGVALFLAGAAVNSLGRN